MVSVMENHYSTHTNNDTIHTKFCISNEMECSRRSSGEDTAVSSSYGDSLEDHTTTFITITNNNDNNNVSSSYDEDEDIPADTPAAANPTIENATLQKTKKNLCYVEAVEDEQESGKSNSSSNSSTASAEFASQCDGNRSIENAGSSTNAVLKSKKRISCLKKVSSVGMDLDVSSSSNVSVSGMKRVDSNVSFSSIHIREYSLTMGDHPDCSWGPPLSLDWQYEVVLENSVEQYESQREPRRAPRHMVQSAVRRRSYLKNVCGFTDDEVKAATKDAQNAKSKRNMTKALCSVQGAQELEEVLSSARRKLKRVLCRKTKEQKKLDDDFVQKFQSSVQVQQEVDSPIEF